MRYWLKLGYFGEAVGEGDAAYWMRRAWVSDSPGRRSSRWEHRPRPRRGDTYPPYGPRYAIGDHLVIYVKGHGCPAILRVAAPPQWDPGRVDREATRGEGDRWGVVTEVIGLHAVALHDAPTLDEISVASTSVMQKGHVELEEWQYRLGEQLIAGASASSEDQRRAEQVPIEAGDVDGYDVAAPSDVRRAVRREARLVRSYEAYLNLRGETVVRTKVPPSAGTRPLFSDLYNPGRDQLIEAKAHARRNDIRMAIGQLADYARFMTSSVSRAVLVDTRPHPDLLALLDSQGIAAIWRHGDGFTDNAGGKFT